jgi:hypothetical protein
MGRHSARRRLALDRSRPRIRATARPPGRRATHPPGPRDRRTRPPRQDPCICSAGSTARDLRRATSIRLTRHEDRHSVARVIFHGNQGELRQPYREGQEDQLGALGFALNALVVWNAQYMDDAIAYLRATGHEIADEDLKRDSPLQHEHIKMLGNFPFTLPHEIAAGPQIVYDRAPPRHPRNTDFIHRGWRSPAITT